MNDTDHSDFWPASPRDELGAGRGEPPQPPRFPDPPRAPEPPRSRRGRLIAVIAVLAVAAALLAAFTAGRLFGTPTHAAASVTPVHAAAPAAPVRATPFSQPASTAAIAAKVDPGLVNVNVVFGYSGARGSATGMVLTPSGEVLTNNHVVQGTTRISVTDIGNGKTYAATVVGYDRTADIAVLQLQGASGLQTVALGDSSKVTVGDRVVALGNAGGAGGAPKVAAGVVTALHQAITAADPGGGNAQRLTSLIETNAAIRPGDSGGPLTNDLGQVIGMDAASSAGFDVRPAVTQGYAIPINEALAIAQQIESGASSSTVHVGPTGFLGVEIVPQSQLAGPGVTQSGAVVGGVLSGLPAQKAGLSQGDVITAVNGRAVTTANELNQLISPHRPGDKVQVRWVDPSGQTHTATVTLASGPPA